MSFNWNGKKTLVTGGAGLIGSHLVDSLVKKGADVVILDNLDKQTHPNGKPDWINKNAKFIHGDVSNYDDLKLALEGVEYVFHQAAFGGFTSELSKYIKSNAMGTALIFEVINNCNIPVKKIIAASSQAVYGEGTYESKNHGIQYPKLLRPVSQLTEGEWELKCEYDGTIMKPLNNNEEKPLYTETIYGISKLAEEKLILGLGRKFNIPTVALRYAVTYGPRQSIFNPYTGVCSIFSTQLLNDISPVIYEDGKQTRDFLYVADNVKANILVAESEEASMEVYNVGREIPVTINELADNLANAYNKEIQPNYTGDFRPGDVRHFVHDTTKIKKLGFEANYSLKEGIKLYAKWILNQGNVNEYFSQKFQTMKKDGIVHSQNKTA